MSEEEIKKLFKNIDERLILHNAIKEPISKDLDNLIKLSIAYEKLKEQLQQRNEVIEEAILYIDAVYDALGDRHKIVLKDILNKYKGDNNGNNKYNNFLYEKSENYVEPDMEDY